MDLGAKVKKIKLWGNGATFDNVIVRNLYKRQEIIFNIPYYADMDVRTLVYLNKINTRGFDFDGIKHRGIDDCKHQIKYCTSINKRPYDTLPDLKDICFLDIGQNKHPENTGELD